MPRSVGSEAGSDGQWDEAGSSQRRVFGDQTGVEGRVLADGGAPCLVTAAFCQTGGSKSLYLSEAGDGATTRGLMNASECVLLGDAVVRSTGTVRCTH
jgi:hypothetical protein